MATSATAAATAAATEATKQPASLRLYGMALLRGLVNIFHTLSMVAVVGAAALVGGVYFFQKSLIYAPSFPPDSRQRVARPDQFGMHDYETVRIRTPDGVNITGYLVLRYADASDSKNSVEAVSDGLRQRSGAASSSDRPLARRTLLYLQANAGNIGHRLPIARIFWSRFNCNVMLISYRGYGHSEGSPDERGLKVDAQAALDYIHNHPRLKETQVILYGQSIGGAVAINLAANSGNRISALVVENTFLSLPKLVPHVLKFMGPLAFLCHQIWDSESAIQTLRKDMPVLFLSGARDELVPPAHMRMLHQRLIESRRKSIKDKSKSSESVSTKESDTKSSYPEKVVFAVLPDGMHSDTCVQLQYFDKIDEFFEWAL